MWNPMLAPQTITDFNFHQIPQEINSRTTAGEDEFTDSELLIYVVQFQSRQFTYPGHNPHLPTPNTFYHRQKR
jgi:hypothetical protein